MTFLYPFLGAVDWGQASMVGFCAISIIFSLLTRIRSKPLLPCEVSWQLRDFHFKNPVAYRAKSVSILNSYTLHKESRLNYATQELMNYPYDC